MKVSKRHHKVRRSWLTQFYALTRDQVSFFHGRTVNCGMCGEVLVEGLSNLNTISLWVSVGHGIVREHELASTLGKCWSENTGVPAASWPNFNHAHIRLEAEEAQSLCWVAELIAHSPFSTVFSIHRGGQIFGGLVGLNFCGLSLRHLLRLFSNTLLGHLR